MSSINVSCYLIVGARINANDWLQNKPSIKVSRGKPKTEAHEVAIKLELNLPIGLFKRPQIVASVTVADNNAPIEIAADVQDNIAQAIRQASGMDVRLIVEAPEQSQ